MVMPVQADQVTIYPSDDAFVNQAEPDQTYNGNSLQVSNAAGVYSYIKFDISSIPDGSTINSATFRVYFFGYSFPPGDPYLRLLDVYRVADDSWSEVDITFNNRPEPDDERLGSGYIGGTGQAWVNFDLFSTGVLELSNDLTDDNLSLMLSTRSAGYYTGYAKEIGAGWGPYLVIDYTPPIDKTRVLEPNGGETLICGSTYTVEWEAPPKAVKFKLMYSTDYGASWILIEKGVEGSSYDWVVPVVKKTKAGCLIKVVSYNEKGKKINGDRSDKVFTIRGLTITSPNGGEVLASGSNYEISWEINGTDEADQATLFYSLDGGLSWKEIETVSGNPGTYSWDVPAPKKNSKKCLVKVVAYDDGKKIGVDKSDGVFTIEVVKVESPNGGETVASGDTVTIEWTTNETKKPVQKVKLFYTKNGGKTWTLIKKIKGSDPGSYDWTIPDVSKEKSKCKVKVVLIGENGKIFGKDVSDSYFTIVPGE